MVKAMADANRHALGFVRNAMLKEWQHRGELLVCEEEVGSITGFISYHHRRDGWTTIHAVCVAEPFRKRGQGSALIAAVVQQAQLRGQQGIRLKCPVDVPANGFYARLGFVRARMETGKRRPLVVWEKRLTPKVSSGCPLFFLSLTHSPSEIRRLIHLWDESGDGRDPFARVIFTPLFSSSSTLTLMRQLKEE